MNKEVGMGLDVAAKKRTNTSGVGKSNNYYEDIYTYSEHSNSPPDSGYQGVCSVVKCPAGIITRLTYGQ